MNYSKLWILCLLAFAFFDQGVCRPQEVGEDPDYLGDGDGDYEDGDDDDYDDAGDHPATMKSKDLSMVLEVGGVAFFPCDVEGNPNHFSRVWRKAQGQKAGGLFVGTVRSTNDQRINQLTNGTLEIRQVEASDAGTYTCMISVSGKPQEVAYELHVKSPAKIVKVTPSDNFVALKKSASLALECIAQGYPTPSIKWFRNGLVLEDQDPSIHGARYTIDNASSDDAGMYKCTATNGQQVPDERSVEIQVLYPPQIKIARDIIPTGEGYESELVCTVTGLKKPELKWYKDNEPKPITPSSRIHLEKRGHDHILRILKTEQSDFGDYKCEAKNNEGEASADLRLTGKPSRPVLQSSAAEEETKNPILTFSVESYAPIMEYELLYKRQEKDEWISVKPAISPVTEGKMFTLKHTFKDLEPGVYDVQVKAKNNYGWSEFSNTELFPREHEGDDLTESGPLEATGSASSQLRISLPLAVTLLVVKFYC